MKSFSSEFNEAGRDHPCGVTSRRLATLLAWARRDWNGRPGGPSLPIFSNLFTFFLPVLAVAAEDIRDIRGPIHIPYPWLWLVYVTLALAILGLAVWLYRKWKQRKRVIVKLPHEIALERLQLALMLMKTGKVREFSIAVSDAVRFYIEDRFQLRAARKTTEEFLHEVLSNPDSPLTAYGPSLEDFLKHCDLAKFAKGNLSPTEMEAMHQSAEKLVNETKPGKEDTNPKKLQEVVHVR